MTRRSHSRFVAPEAARRRVGFEQAVDRHRLEAGGIGETLRGPSGRSGQRDVGRFGAQDPEQRIDQCRLADPGTAGDYQHLGGERHPDRRPLAVGERQAGALLDPGDRLVGIDRRPGRAAGGERLQPLGDVALGLIQCREKDAASPVHFICHYRAARDLLGEGGLDEVGRHLEQCLGQRNQVFDRQPAMPVIHRLGEGVRDAGAHPHHRGLVDAEPHRDLVGALEADAADVAGEAVWVFRDQPHRVGAIDLVDAHRPRRPDAVIV
jgi:hypothetical protein